MIPSGRRLSESSNDCGTMTKPSLSPLLVTAVANASEPPPADANHETVLERLVSPHPLHPSASITTVLVQIHTPQSARTRTIARVWSGPDGGNPPQLHASFTLPTTRIQQSLRKRLCWAALGDTHLRLCVLVDRNTVALYDVYPQASAPSSDAHWTLALPFDCDWIDAIPPPRSATQDTALMGLLLQRQPDPTDRTDEDAHFILQSPPKLWNTQPPSTQPYVPNHAADGLHVVSLFSLHHPLEEVHPVGLGAPSLWRSEPRHVTDPLERILWMGTATWNEQQNAQVLIVTYHSLYQRHALWALQEAPTPPATLPLHQHTARLLAARANHPRTLQDTLLLPHAPMDDQAQGPTVSRSRQDALADALGVKRAPRLSLELTTPSGHGRPRLSKELLSPRSEHQDLSWTAAPTTASSQSNMPTHDSAGPFDAIHARVTMECLFTETNHGSLPAQRVFLASDETASGTLTLCLLQPQHNDMTHNQNNSMRLVHWHLAPESRSNQASLRMSRPGTLRECRSALPITVAPAPARRQPVMATDVLLLTPGHGLMLYRANQLVVEYQLPRKEGVSGETLRPTGLEDAVENRVTLECGPVGRKRVRLDLQPRSGLAEKVLLALESALAEEPWASEYPMMGLKIRADVCRLEQTLRHSTTSRMLASYDAGWVACYAVLLSIVKKDLFDCDPSMPTVQERPPTTAWEILLQSDPSSGGKDFQSIYKATVREWAQIGSETMQYLTKTPLKRRLTRYVFDALHFVMDECKLSANTHEFVPRAAALLLQFCRLGDPKDDKVKLLLDYYGQVSGWESHDAGSDSVLDYVQGDVLTSFAARPPSTMTWACQSLERQQIEPGLSEVGCEGINSSCRKIRAVVRLVRALLRSSTDCNEGGDILNVLLDEGLYTQRKIREELPPGVALACLERIFYFRNDPTFANVTDWSAKAWSLIGREDIAHNIQVRNGTMKIHKDYNTSSKIRMEDFADEEGDGLVPLELGSASLFEDNRIHEAARLLRSSRPVFLRVIRNVETSDLEYEIQKQKRLMLLARRTLALPVGRGMLTLGNLEPLTVETLPIPNLCLKGRVPPANASLALDESDCPLDMRVWPEFHNGVAAGLRLLCYDETNVKVSRTWIVYNRPHPVGQETEEATQQFQRKSHSHGGFLLALGLRGHLNALDMTDVHDYLTKGQVTTTVGVLLGLAANKRCSCDIAISKMLCLHIPSLIPNHFSAIDVASSVQTAAVMGTGLLFMKSCNRMITEFLINEIGKRPDTDSTVFDREAYTLACGIALGMVNLQIGDKSNEFNKAQGLADLHLDDRLNTYIKGGVDLKERQRNREASDRFSVPSASSSGDNERCSTVYEGDQINIDITAPAATLALALMYMKTGNRTIASLLEIPDTHFLLEFIRPDFLALRVIAKSLIMWNDINPSKWIANQIPGVISQALADLGETAKRAMGGRTGIEDAGQHTKLPEYDRRAVRQIYVHVVAGACFGLGLRYAGTADKEAKAAIIERVLELRSLRESNDLISAALRPEYSILDSCLGCTAISLAMVLAGTGDIDALRLFKILRWRCEEDSSYGLHMIYGMAIGLLFLGGGACTLGREPEDIAALVAAFYPRFPVATSDNQYHLQACRHLYAIAVKRAVLQAVDVDTNEIVSIPVELRFWKGSPIQTRVPCLLKNSDKEMSELATLSESHYPLRVCLSRSQNQYTFFVKKRIAYGLSLRQELAPTELMKSFSKGHFIRSFADHMDVGNDEIMSRLYEDVFMNGSEDALVLYLSTLKDESLLSVWDLRFIRLYFQRMSRPTDEAHAINLSTIFAYLFEKKRRLFLDSSKIARARQFATIMYGKE